MLMDETLACADSAVRNSSPTRSVAPTDVCALAGGDTTFLQAWHTLEALMCFEPTLLDDYPNLKSYVERFEAIPAIKAHMESDAFLHWYVCFGVSFIS